MRVRRADSQCRFQYGCAPPTRTASDFRCRTAPAGSKRRDESHCRAHNGTRSRRNRPLRSPARRRSGRAPHARAPQTARPFSPSACGCPACAVDCRAGFSGKTAGPVLDTPRKSMPDGTPLPAVPVRETPSAPACQIDDAIQNPPYCFPPRCAFL